MSLRSCTSAVALGALVGAAGAGCFYTDTVNTEPQAQLQKATAGPHYRGSFVTFNAYTSDDPDGDRDQLIAEWRAIACEDTEGTRCPPGNEIKLDDGSIFDEFTVGPIDTKLPILVILRVRDRRGAFADDSMLIQVQNRDPELSLQVQGFEVGGGYPLGTWMQIFATATDEDEDALTYDWTLYPPVGSVPEDVRWQEIVDPDNEVYELEPDVHGLWTVEVTVTDSDGGSTTEQVPILVQADAPPCIAIADPLADPVGTYILDAGDEPRRFAVLSVTDDLDPYPLSNPDHEFLGEAGFRWYIATPDTGGELIEVEGHEVADYFVDPSGFAPGDPLELRVEIDDRIGREIPCAEDQPTCSVIGDPSCLQRVTWGIEIR